MAIITAKDIEKISHLSKISIDLKQKDQLINKLDKILDWMEILKEVDTTNVEPISNVHQMSLTIQKDQVKQEATTAEVLKNAPDAKYDYFTVSKVIE